MPPRRKKQPTRRSRPATTRPIQLPGPPAVPSIGSAIDPSLLQDLPTTTTELITADGTPDDFTIDTQARDWINDRVNEEIARLASLGASATPLAVSNFGIVIEENEDDTSNVAVNRIELKSTYDFSRMRNCSMRTQGPMLVPYLFDSQLKTEQGVSVPNGLDQWLLINQTGGRARHVIEQFVDVSATEAEEAAGEKSGKE
ncbi:hypothetical protein BCR44DRAFT_1443313 [Catenaria anguillulae PL171]|uniref:Uncharacterized protein n=1 Tax=Catenaria anguillulae PL171 TaxID=765915 RepID=A0A1Y2H8X7_9FUNG|nr:hypothetical protein BCR44DRAFT_1443313 [Catenaria anguillulae PL171]